MWATGGATGGVQRSSDRQGQLTSGGVQRLSDRRGGLGDPMHMHIQRNYTQTHNLSQHDSRSSRSKLQRSLRSTMQHPSRSFRPKARWTNNDYIKLRLTIRSFRSKARLTNNDYIKLRLTINECMMKPRLTNNACILASDRSAKH